MRNLGITNCAPYASAPPVGASGDTYWNTTNKTLYVSDGTAWIPWPTGGGTTLPTGGQMFQALSKYGGADNAIEWAWPEKVIRRIDQVAHGFTIGNVLRLASNGAYVKAQADTEVNAEVVGAVYSVFSPDAFILMTHGRIAGGSGLVTGAPYYLSPILAGAITNVEPTTPGQVSKPVFIADSPDAGWFFNMRGTVIPNPLAGTGVRAPYMRRYRSVAPSLSTGGWTQGDFDLIRPGQNTAQSTDFTWDSTNNGFKIVQPGLYLFTFTMNGYGNTGRRATMFTVGALLAGEWSRTSVQNLTTTGIGQSHSDVRYCLKDDLICVFTYQDSGTLWNQLLNPFDFTCTLLSPG